MGVGNWSWSPSSGMPEFTVHVDDLPETFEEYRGRAEAAWIEHARTHFASLIEDDVVPDFAWAQENLSQSEIESAIEEEFPHWDDQEGYSVNASGDRLDDLIESLGESLQEESLQITDRVTYLKHVDDAISIARGKLVDVVVKPWETQLYIGVGPSAKLEEQGKFDFSPAVERFVAMHMSACAPTKSSFYELSASHDYEFTMSPRVISLLREGRKMAAASELLDATVDLARTLEVSGSSDDCDAFQRRFGLEPSHVTMQSTSDQIDILFDYAEAIGDLPTSVAKAYQVEFAKARDAVKKCLALSGEQVYQRDTGWTSKRVDLSDFRDVALVSLNEGQLGQIRWVASLGEAMSQMQLYLGVEQVAFVKQSALAGLEDRLRDSFNPVTVEAKDGLLALYSAGSGLGGMAVLDASYLSSLRYRSPAKIAHDGAGFFRDDLPAWLEPVTDPKGLRDVVQAVASLPGLESHLVMSGGDLAVSGMLVLKDGGGVQSLYATNDPVPGARSTYRPLVIHGQPAMDFEREARLSNEVNRSSLGMGR